MVLSGLEFRRSSMAFGTLVGMLYSTIAGHGIYVGLPYETARCTCLSLYNTTRYSLL